MKKPIFLAIFVFAGIFFSAPFAFAQTAVLSIPAGTYEAAPGGTITFPLNIDVSSMETAPTDIEWHFVYDSSDVASLDILPSDPLRSVSCSPESGGSYCWFGNIGSYALTTGEVGQITVTLANTTLANSTNLTIAGVVSYDFMGDGSPVDGTANPVSTTLTITQPVVVTPDTTSPQVVLTSPTSDSKVSGSSVGITATSTDNVAVAGITFFYDSTNQIGSEITATSSPDTYVIGWDTTKIADGVHTLIAVSRDSSNNFATSTPVSVVIENNPVVVPPAPSEVSVGNGQPYLTNVIVSTIVDTTTNATTSENLSSTTAQISTSSSAALIAPLEIASSTTSQAQEIPEETAPVQNTANKVALAVQKPNDNAEIPSLPLDNQKDSSQSVQTSNVVQSGWGGAPWLAILSAVIILGGVVGYFFKKKSA